MFLYRGGCRRAPLPGEYPKLSHIHPHPRPGDPTSEVKGSQGYAPSRGSRAGSCLPLPWAGSRLPPSLPLSSRGFSCVSGSPLLSLGRTLSLDGGAPLPGGPPLRPLTSSPLQRPFVQRSSHSWGLGMRAQAGLRVPYSTHYTSVIFYFCCSHFDRPWTVGSLLIGTSARAGVLPWPRPAEKMRRFLALMDTQL